MIGRPRYHYGGRFFNIINSKNELIKDSKSKYYSEYISKEREFRVYVFNGSVYDIQEKFPRNRSIIQWNSSMENGIFKSMKRKNWPKELWEIALSATKIIKMNCSAVDVIEKDDKFYVLELNSSPRMNTYVAEKFKNQINLLLKKYKD